MLSRLDVLAGIQNCKEIHSYLEELRDGRLSHYGNVVEDLQYRFDLNEAEGKAILNQWFNQYGKM